ncbi:MAG: hypothetical protein SF187_10925 [Deltaproteobacteria bacterium]|nr:hypothetical protein [Deltaproteobacteria bacterium]
MSFEVGHRDSLTEAPTKFVPAVVPGAVQLDWAAAHNWPPHWEANNFEAYAWMENKHWLYRCRLPYVDRQPGQQVFFVCQGIDYHFQISANGAVLLEQEGMFTPVQLDVSALAAGTELTIALRPVPKYPKAHRPKAEASRSVKPAVSYGWDFHPRLIPLGVWDETYLELKDAAALTGVEIKATLDVQNNQAVVACEVQTQGVRDGHQLQWHVQDQSGVTVISQVVALPTTTTVLTATLHQPRLWWCNGQGEAHLYQSTVSLLDDEGKCIEQTTKRFGVRRVRLVMNEGAWDEPSTFPKTRSVPPMTLELNGRRVFAKGSNWVCPDIFPGTLTRDHYAALLHQAHNAHFNILRCWGGAAINKTSFYDLCDELGIMVWQEFPLSCNTYEDDERYLTVLNQESRSIIKKLRQHACLAMWCGGNELFNWWSAMTDQHLALRLLNANCLELDPLTPYLPTSPVMGVGHGDYRFRDEHGKEVFAMFSAAKHTAYTEFGVPGPASVQTLSSFIPLDELYPPRRGTSWQTHHAFDAWFVAPESWLFVGLLDEYFGPTQNLEQLVQRGQLLQSEGYKCLFEEARRQKPYASMALNWCYNEPWPTAANNSVVSWPAQAKPALHAIGDACRPSLFSAQIPRFRWLPEETLALKLTLLHDAPTPLAEQRVEVFIKVAGEPPLLVGTWDAPATSANTNVPGPTLAVPLPKNLRGVFDVVLVAESDAKLSSRYTLCGPP